MKKKPLQVHVKKIPGDTTKFMLTIEFDSTNLSQEKQKALWEGIAKTLAAVLTQKECEQFLEKFREAALTAA